VSADELVVGDLVWLRVGGRIPADIRIVYANELKIERSWITGDDEPFELNAQPCINKNVGAFASENMAFNGSLCVHGEAIGIVIRTANNTV
jgi:sodium/potassium-transporting ATPase subunit alpha